MIEQFFFLSLHMSGGYDIMGKNKQASKKIAGHVKATNEHLRKQDKYGPSDTSASKTIRNSIYHTKKEIHNSGQIKREESFWGRKFPEPKKPW